MDSATHLTSFIILGLMVALQIGATIALVRAKRSYSRAQVFIQLLIIFAIPILGAAVCLFFIGLTGPPERSPEKQFIDGADADGAQSRSSTSFYGEAGGDHAP
jgi:hypothetical protein